MLRILIIFLCGYLFSCSTKPVKNPDDAKRPFLGIEFLSEITKLKTDRTDSSRGLSLKLVYPDAPGFKGGLRTDDIIVEINKKKVSDYNFKSGLEFTEFMAVQPLGSVIEFTVLRGEKETLGFSLTLQPRKYSFGESYKERPVFKFEDEVRDSNIDLKSIMTKYKIIDEATALFNRFKLMVDEGDSLRPAPVIEVQKNPLEIQRYSFWVKDQLDERLHTSFLNTGALLRKFAVSEYKPLPLESKYSPIERLVKSTQLAQSELNLAFADLSSSSRLSLLSGLPQLAKKFSEGIYIHDDDNKKNLASNLKTIELIKQMKPQRFANSYSQLTQIFNRQLLKDLKTEAQALLNQNGKPVLRIKSRLGTVVIAGPADDIHVFDSSEDIFLVIDLGGDDQYLDLKASIIDFDGNDSYESSKEWMTAGSIMDVKFLIDVEGDDRYVGLAGSFAATLFGVSALWDLNGADTYRCVKYCFGTAFGGVAVLIDDQGNDRYDSLLMSQGLGIAGGYGLLMDLQGQDFYYSKGIVSSGYGDAGQFDGWSQGVAIGLRGFLSGGIGILYDRQGEDSFDSGDFSQGGGYYFGWGLLINSGKENDRYMASRYSQGFTAHYAVGTFLEAGGNDRYISKHDVGIGMSWDLGITLFEDFGGDDRYMTCPHCLGTAAQSGFTIFSDDDGKDIYKGSMLPNTSPVSNEYHTGVSLGFFIDRGQKEDHYEKFKNNSEALREKYQIFIDN